MGNRNRELSVSLFSADFLHIARELEKVNTSCAASLHIDVMDGKFVELYGLNQNWLSAAETVCDLPMEVHFMTELSRERLERFFFPKVSSVIVHVEAAERKEVEAAIRLIRSSGRRAGIAIAPDTNIGMLDPFLPQVDEVLVMTGQPGKPGATYQPEMLERVRELRRKCKENLRISVDGGISEKTAGDCIQAGADKLVIGRSFYRNTREIEQIFR